MIDPEPKTVTVIARNELVRTDRELLVWYPPEAADPVEIRLSDIFVDSD